MATRTIRPDTHTPPEFAILADILAHKDEAEYPTTIFVVTTAPSLESDILMECKDFAAATKEYNLLFAEVCQEIVEVFSGPPDPSDDVIPMEWRIRRRYQDHGH